MAKPINKNMREILLKYQTGQYGINQLARIYKVDKATISRFIKANNIKINQHAKNAIEYSTYGISEFQKMLNNEKINQQLINTSEEQESAVDSRVEAIIPDINALTSEVIDIIREKNPQFAKGFQALSALILKRSSEILQQDKVTSGDINAISKAMQNVNETLGVIPKAPTIAQQFNFNSKSKESKKDLKPIDLEIKFI